MIRYLCVFLFLTVGCGPIPKVVDPDTLVPGGRIAFIGGGAEYNFQLYVMNSDGTHLETVLPDVDPRSDFSGQTWSPDGRQLAFASNLGGDANFDIYMMNLDGSGLVRIVDDSGGDFAPSWSPTGTQIAFQAHRRNETGWDIYVVNVDGTGERNITQSPEDEEVATWSPDGSQLVYQLRTGTGSSIWIMDADGNNRRPVVEGDGRVVHETPVWSPDGRKIAFASNMHQDWTNLSASALAQYEIYTVDVDGTDIRRITHVSDAAHAARWPSWDPTGQTLVFELSEVLPSTLEIAWRLATVNVDGSNLKKIPIVRQGRVPRWSPR